MVRKVLSFFAVALFVFSLAGSAFAEEMKGQITKVENGGREITVKSKGGKQLTVKISGSRTDLEGVKSRSDLKEGQKVTVDHEGGEAKKVQVSK
jgi:hypothetical protein